MEKLLEIKNLRVQYNTDEAVVYALNNFSLELNKGEILGVVGETGAGKTTMALSVMQLLLGGGAGALIYLLGPFTAWLLLRSGWGLLR